MANYELIFIVAVVGVTLFIALALRSTNSKWTIVLAVPGLVLFTSVVVSQINRLKAGQWTLWDVILVAAILFIVIWITPDVMNIVRQWRGRNQK